LIERDPKSADIIKPILRGRDIKRYHSEFADKWLIYSYQGIHMAEYTAIIEHLENYKIKLLKRTGGARRNKSGTIVSIPYCWNELQVDYYSSGTYKEFEKERIAWPETAMDNQFGIVKPFYMQDKTSFFMTCANRYLLAVLNSSVSRFFFDSLVSKMRGGYFSMSKIYVEQFPIPIISKID